MATAEELPPLVTVRTRQRPVRVRRLFHTRPRWLLRTFLVHHMLGVLDALERCYHRRAALGADDAQDVADRAVVDHFRRSLPALHAGRLVALLLIAVLVVGQLGLVPLEAMAGQTEREAPAEPRVTGAAGSEVGPVAGRPPSEDGAREASGAAPQVLVWLFGDEQAKTRWAKLGRSAATLNPGGLAALLEQSLSSATLDFGSTGRLLGSLLEADLRTLLVLVGYLALLLYLVLRPLVSVFRLKRLLFNLDPDTDRYLARTSTSWHVPRSTGIYRLEEAAFRDLGKRSAPTEKPFDLGVLTLPTFALTGAALATAFAVGSQIAGFSVVREVHLLGILIGTVLAGVLVAPIVGRLVWLRGAWDRRRSLRPDVDPWGERVLPGSAAFVLLRRPALLAAIAALPYAVLLRGSVESSIRFYADGTVAATDLLRGEITYLLPTLLASGLVVMVLALPWWYRVLRELRDLGAVTGQPLGRWPAADVLLALVVPVVGWIHLVSATVRRVRRAQRRVAVPTPRRQLWLLTLSVLVPPLLIALLQSQLNTVWRVVARPSPEDAPPAPLDPSTSRPPADRSGWNRVALLAAAGAVSLLAVAAVEPAPDEVGDDPELDVLWRACEGGDVDACAELTWTAPVGSTYSSGALGTVRTGCTDGDGDACLRLSLLAAPDTDDGELAERNLPVRYGDAPLLDASWDACSDGDGDACLELAWSAPWGSEYAELAERRSPDRYGDAASLDVLWDACAEREVDACEELFYTAPWGSGYVGFALSSVRERCADGDGDACRALWWMADPDSDDAALAERHMPSGLHRLWYEVTYRW